MVFWLLRCSEWLRVQFYTAAGEFWVVFRCYYEVTKVVCVFLERCYVVSKVF